MPAYPKYAPDYAVQINGQHLPAQVRTAITSVRYEEGRDAANRVELSIANPYLKLLKNHIRGLGFQHFPTSVTFGPMGALQAPPAGTFDIDNKFELSLGYAPD